MTQSKKNMKKILFTTVFIVFFSVSLISQTKNEQLSSRKFIYSELTYTGNFSKNSTIEADFGEETHWFKTKKLTNEKGKKLRFNTIVDALNYMGNEGWELVQIYVVPNTDNISTQHYVFKKEIVTETPVSEN